MVVVVVICDLVIKKRGACFGWEILGLKPGLAHTFGPTWVDTLILKNNISESRLMVRMCEISLRVVFFQLLMLCSNLSDDYTVMGGLNGIPCNQVR